MDAEKTLEAITKLLDKSGVMVGHPLLSRIAFLCGEDVTQRQRNELRAVDYKIYNYIHGYWSLFGKPPTIVDVEAATIYTEETVLNAISRLKYHGYIALSNGANETSRIKIVQAMADRAA